MKLTQIGSKVIYHLREEGLSALPAPRPLPGVQAAHPAERREHTAARAQADGAIPAGWRRPSPARRSAPARGRRPFPTGFPS